MSIQPFISALLRLRNCYRLSAVSTRPITTMSDTKSIIAVCQMRATNDKTRNYEICESLIRKAKTEGAKMIFLPECFDFIGANSAETQAAAEFVDGDIMSKYKKLAKDAQVWLSLGGMHRKVDHDTRHCNSHVVVDSQGDVRAIYDKTHLFDLDLPELKQQETDSTRPGERILAPVDTPIGRVGLGICYDLRFPEMSLVLRDEGAEVLTFPSAFTVPTGQAHWHVLLRSRAIENQCHVVAAAQVGKHNEKRTSYGHALIIDPWGKVLAECTQENDVQLAELDMTSLRDIRRRMPVTSHRRQDLYGKVHVIANNFQDPDVDPTYTFGHVTIHSSSVFYRSHSSYAFVNIKPVLPGHTLVAPIGCVEKFTDLTPQQTSDLFLMVQKVAKVLKLVYKTDSVTVAIQDGVHSGQTIKHVHVHILPRKSGDFSENDDIYQHLEHHDNEMTSQPRSRLRTREEMTQEASMMREYFTS